MRKLNYSILISWYNSSYNVQYLVISTLLNLTNILEKEATSLQNDEIITERYKIMGHLGGGSFA